MTKIKNPEEILKEALKEHDRLSAEIIEVLSKNTPGEKGVTVMTNIYFVRFKPIDGMGINIQFEVEAATPEKAYGIAAKELEKRGPSADYSFECIILDRRY